MIKSFLMSRDDMTSEEADDLITEALTALEDLVAKESSLDEMDELITDYFGFLEPDYRQELFLIMLENNLP